MIRGISGLREQLLELLQQLNNQGCLEPEIQEFMKQIKNIRSPENFLGFLLARGRGSILEGVELAIEQFYCLSCPNHICKECEIFIIELVLCLFYYEYHREEI